MPGFTSRGVRRLRISAIKLGNLGERCCTMTIEAGKSAGKADKILLKALSPSAEAVSATISKYPEKLFSFRGVRSFFV